MKSTSKISQKHCVREQNLPHLAFTALCVLVLRGELMGEKDEIPSCYCLLWDSQRAGILLVLLHCSQSNKDRLTKPRPLESHSSLFLSYLILVMSLSLDIATSLLCDYGQVSTPLQPQFFQGYFQFWILLLQDAGFYAATPMRTSETRYVHYLYYSLSLFLYHLPPT